MLVLEGGAKTMNQMQTVSTVMYAAHVLREWNFQQDWTLLQEWVRTSEKYTEADGPCFEEVLKYYNLMQADSREQIEPCRKSIGQIFGSAVLK